MQYWLNQGSLNVVLNHFFQTVLKTKIASFFVVFGFEVLINLYNNLYSK